MIDSITALSTAGLDVFGTLVNTIPKTTTDTGLGPDYLLSILSSSSGGSATSGYSEMVQSRLPAPDSLAGEKRATILEQAAAQMKEDDFAGARDTVQSLLKDNPTDPTANYITGRAYLKEGQYREAERYFVQVASATPDNEQAQSDLEAVRVLQRGEAATLVQIKRMLANDQTAPAGVRLAGYLLESKPENLDARLALADYYDRLKKPGAAGAMYVEALDHVTGDRAGELATRIEAFATAYPDDPAAHDLLAQAYAAAGQLNQAEEEFNKALALSKEDPAFQTALKQDFADVYTKLGHEALNRNDERDAVDYFDKALKLNRDDTRQTDVVTLQTTIGERALRGGVINVALRAFAQAAANIPTTEGEAWRERLIRDYGQLATKLNEAGDLRRAISARLGAYQLDTSDDTLKRKLADAYDAYGQEFFNEGKYGEALRQFKAAAKLYPNEHTYVSHISNAQRLL